MPGFSWLRWGQKADHEDLTNSAAIKTNQCRGWDELGDWDCHCRHTTMYKIDRE